MLSWWLFSRDFLSFEGKFGKRKDGERIKGGGGKEVDKNLDIEPLTENDHKIKTILWFCFLKMLFY